MKDRPHKKQTGRMNYVWVLAGIYLLYLAYQLFRDAYTGGTDYPLLGIGGGVVFVAVGGFLLYREWKAYQYAKAHVDDPSSWSDEPEEPDNSEKLDDPEDPDDLDDSDDLDELEESKEGKEGGEA